MPGVPGLSRYRRCFRHYESAIMEVFLFAEEFSKMKDEVPPALIGSHVKMVGQAVKDGKSVDDHFGLDKSGIAGTGKLMFS